MQIMSSDLYESTFLHCCGARLVDLFMDKTSVKPTVVFTFQGNEALQQLQTEYHTGDALVNAADYRRSMIALKRLMFDLIDGRINGKQRQDKLRLRSAGQNYDGQETQRREPHHETTRHSPCR